jgi:anti-sigma B factor antagonist
MKIKTRSIGDVSVLDINGKIMFSDGALLLRDALQSTLQSGKSKIVLNLGHTKSIDRTGIDELVNSYESITHDGGQIRLLNLTKKISDPMVITKLMTIYRFYNDEKAAIESFQ